VASAMTPIGLSNDDLTAVVGRSRRTIERSHRIMAAAQVRIAACAHRLLPRLAEARSIGPNRRSTGSTQSVIFRLDRECFVVCQAALLSQ
jgi:hypothetical protein